MGITSADEFRQHIDSGVNRNDAHIAKTLQTLRGLKEDVKAGRLSLTQYNQILEPNARYIHGMIGGGLSGGSRSADEAKRAGAETILNEFMSYDPTSSTYRAKLPFTKSEYASLPENVLPTRQDAQRGLFDPYMAPIERYQGDSQNGGGPGGTGVGSGGIEGGGTDQGRDEAKLLAEAEFAKQQRQATLDANKTSRSGYISQITDQLLAQQKRQFSEAAPDIMEDLNSRGLLRSSALGDRFSKEQARLAAETSERLGLMGVEGAMDDLGTNTAINESYIGDRGNAIGRRFSLEDFARQYDAAIRLGAATAPEVQGKGSGEKWANGINTAANATRAVMSAKSGGKGGGGAS